MKIAMQLPEIVEKLIGPINPVGDHNLDISRLCNLKEMCALVNRLLFKISQSANYKDHEAASMKMIGSEAYKFLVSVMDQLKDDIHEN